MLQITVVEPEWLVEHFYKLLQQSASGALSESAGASGAVKPDASIIADLEDRVRRTIAQHLHSFGDVGRVPLRDHINNTNVYYLPNLLICINECDCGLSLRRKKGALKRTMRETTQGIGRRRNLPREGAEAAKRGK